ncbi:MAG: hypothetical protein L0Y56_19035 [Nitrospira sp.]|nr:hypothetical protein [Nitrospira sp.]
MRVLSILLTAVLVVFQGCATMGSVPEKYGDLLCNLTKGDPISADQCLQRKARIETRKAEAKERLELYNQMGDARKVEEEMLRRRGERFLRQMTQPQAETLEDLSE